MLKHRKDCPALWGFIKRWWKTRQHRKGLSFSTVYGCGSWRYKIRDTGWHWGRFATQQEAIDAGKIHFANAWKYGNDYGAPHTDLCNCFDEYGNE